MARNKQFTSVRVRRPNVNAFDLSYEKKMSFKMGDILPCYLQEIVPGDRLRAKSEVMLRFAPMLAPIMHRVDVYVHYFFVPNRLIWDNWEDFITGGEDGTSTPTAPYIEINNTNKAYFYKGLLPDYFGLPITNDGGSAVTVSQNLRVSSLPFRAMVKIYNDYYRNPNLVTAVTERTGDGDDSSALSDLTTVRRRMWEKDYFTTCLPWTQRGGEVELEMSFTPTYKSTSDIKTTAGGTPSAGANIQANNVSGQYFDIASGSGTGRVENLSDPQTVDSGITVNELRRATKLQQWLENNARGGSRYIEQILSHFAVRSSDARLQRPEYLGGGKQNVVVSEVLNNSEVYDSTDTLVNPQGNMSGHGISVGQTMGFNRFFEEHGYVIGCIQVLPRTAYQNQVNKTWLRTDKLDYYWPEFARLGEQAVTNQEVYHDWSGTKTDTDTFGYQARYAEYKFKESEVSGDFRDDFDYWHMSRQFSSAPTLNSGFVASGPTHRIFRVTDSTVDKIYGQIYHNVQALRPMPIYGTPAL